MKRQYEQECNAEALRGLGVPVVDKIGKDFSQSLNNWINSSFICQANYENNVPRIVERILDFKPS